MVARSYSMGYQLFRQPAELIELKLSVKIPWNTRVVCSYSMGNNSFASLHNNALENYWSEWTSLCQTKGGDCKLNIIAICDCTVCVLTYTTVCTHHSPLIMTRAVADTCWLLAGVGGHARVFPSILLHGVSDNDGAGPVDTRRRCQGSAVEFPGDDGRGDARAQCTPSQSDCWESPPGPWAPGSGVGALKTRHGTHHCYNTVKHYTPPLL